MRGPRAGRTAVSGDPQAAPRARAGRAPDVFRPGAWVPMRCHRDDEEVDFVIVGTGAGGGTLACKLAEAGFSVVAMDTATGMRRHGTPGRLLRVRHYTDLDTGVVDP